MEQLSEKIANAAENSQIARINPTDLISC